MITTKLISNALYSLQMSTILTAQYKNEGYILKGRNSSYMSHKSFEMIEGHDKECILILSNDNHTLIVSEREHDTQNLLMKRLPAFLLTSILSEFMLPIHPKWVKNDYLYFYVINNFDGYNEDGTPKFEKKAYEIGEKTLHRKTRKSRARKSVCEVEETEEITSE